MSCLFLEFTIWVLYTKTMCLINAAINENVSVFPGRKLFQSVVDYTTNDSSELAHWDLKDINQGCHHLVIYSTNPSEYKMQ